MSLFGRAVRYAARKARAGLVAAGKRLRMGAVAMTGDTYKNLYERHAKTVPPESSIGDGDYDLIGRIELGILLSEGMTGATRLVDFGCGTGRLAVHAVGRLPEGEYIGTDIAEGMLVHARESVARRYPGTRCRVSWVKQPLDVFPLRADSADMICAFSVFTHMEHEDTFRYLKDALRVVRPGGKFVFSCLPVSLGAARDIFVESASHTFAERWASVRNVTTSVELMETIAGLAGWRVARWYPGDEMCIPMPDSSEMRALGQSTCVLQRP